MDKKLFYKANPLIFERAKELRNNMAHAETILWGYLRTKPLGYKFRRQHPLGAYLADFFCYKLKLAIEVDGSVHENEDVKRNDAERKRVIESHGIKMLRFMNDDVLIHLNRVIEKIQTCII